MSLNTFPCNPYPISTEELNKGNNDDLNTRVSALETAVEEIDNDKADLGVIAAEFDAAAGTYEIGDLVTNKGKLYEFTSDHSTPGAWDPTEVTEKTVADEVNFVKSGLTNLTINTFGNNVDLSSYTSDDNLYTFSNDGYVCISSTTATTGTGQLTIYDSNSLGSNFGFVLNATGAWQGNAVFVKKGMRAKVNALATGFVALYIPLT